ncbi:MAG: SUMF1/EgtB/PvdO family nonheme iron enzyme [Akkermansiaceae bacterium]|nr:SUMF1/EgtB/PvdO family nonheme iron enzyme [Akkermansiaceae bacterium]MCP5551138.1 SUMF1/EgtB/PvdO family nonheme iron enzyme [Akkermansiaceae bacterium]
MPDPPSSKSQRALPAGRRIHEYEILRDLGSGGFGITYLARDLNLERDVVIKENLPVFAFRDSNSSRVYPNSSRGEDAGLFEWSLDNFVGEARTLAKFDHPHIVRILRVFEANGTAYFVMPFLEGRPFDEAIEERKKSDEPFWEAELRDLLVPLLGALGELHGEGIYHRDIKPANILITGKGPVLIDFGAARQRVSEKSLTVVESPGYTPFEQMQTRGNVGPWSDLYALGAVLYRAITFEAPPKSADRVRNDAITVLSESGRYTGLYGKGFLASIDRALAFDEEERPRSAAEWQAALKEKVPSPIPKPRHPAPAADTPTARGGRRKRPAVIFAGLAFAGLAAWGGWAWSRHDSAPPPPPTVADAGEAPPPEAGVKAAPDTPARIGTRPPNPVAPGDPGAPPAPAYLEIGSDPPGAKILVDGEAIGQTLAGDRPLKREFPVGAHRVVAQYRNWPEQQRTVAARAGNTERLAFAFEPVAVRVESDPPGAEIRPVAGGKTLGKTPADLAAGLEPGPARWEIALDGYETVLHAATLEPGSNPAIRVTLKPEAIEPNSASRAAPFVNSLGMKFVPVPIGNGPSAGKRVLFSIWETRVRDYAAYAAANPGVDDEWKDYELKGHGQGPDHPVVNVSWEDAKAFCAWLTRTERAAGRIGAGDAYRLPTDVEWSWAVGIGDRESAGATPKEKDEKIEGEYPWGTAWPPPDRVGNYLDSEAKRAFDCSVIDGYDDGQAFTAPVGSYGANALGLHDLGGNVWEWCEDSYDGSSAGARVLRGASWYINGPGNLLSSDRLISTPVRRSSNGGFRCVLTIEPGSAPPVRSRTEKKPGQKAKGNLVDPVKRSDATSMAPPEGALILNDNHPIESPTKSYPREEDSPITPSNTASSSRGVPMLSDLVSSGHPAAATKASPFENSLGMRFVPVPIGNGPSAGKTVLFSIWETRVQDYAAYAAANAGVDMKWKDYEYRGRGQGPDHPVVNVSWEDAKAFCAWLTSQERAAGRIGAGDAYRLPSDVEWSWAVGIGDRESASATPKEKDSKIEGVYPWGTAWPPPDRVGNYADSEAKRAFDFSVVGGYDDGQAFTAPVGSYGANALGLHDLGGNVWEWCEDSYDGSSAGARVLRGASWDLNGPGDLLSSNRDYFTPVLRYNYFGFRCVLVVGVAR